jgi:steroid 5-alpha reductase family enzyme
MRKATARVAFSIPVILLVAVAISWAGSQSGRRVGGVPVFPFCGILVFLTVSCALAAITAAAAQPLGALAVLGTAVWTVGFAIETIADRQKAVFRADPVNRDRFISTGLWAWSRHPNYCGEILLWFGVALIALPALSGWSLVTLISPVFVYLLLTRVSGIPLLESRSDAKWGNSPEYQAYKARTPMLWLRPPTGS